MAKEIKIAVLIDGDNAQSGLIEQILNEASKHGRVTVKRIYGDWTEPGMKQWKDILNEYAVIPVHKFSYTTGKNSTDTAMIMDAMELMHSKNVEGFCIVSSDSDYTGLAHKIRERGLFVMGVGRSTTPKAFVKACEKFINVEILEPQKAKDAKKIELSLVDKAFAKVVDIDTGHALLSKLKSALIKIDPTFDERNFGFSNFRKFCGALKPNYEVVLHEDKKTVSLRKKE